MRNSFQSQICFVLPRIILVSFVIYTRLLLNWLHRNKISSYFNISCHQKKQMNHRSTLEQLTVGNYTATQLREDWFAQFSWSWVSQSSTSCVAIALPIPQFSLLHSVQHVQLSLIKILGKYGCFAVASFLGMPSPQAFSIFWICEQSTTHMEVYD
jgi:hypothetical protein